MTLGLEVHPPDAWADAVAAALIARIREQPALRLCLPTGDTPRPVYARLVEASARAEVSFAQATVVLLDEWVGLPPGDPARCDVRLGRELLDGLATKPSAVYWIDPDAANPAASAASHDIVAALGIDLALLGIGTNGHVGFNEPGSTPDSPTRVVELSRSSREAATERYGASAVPTAGVTIGLARLLGAGECWLLATGERKADVLRRALREPESPDCPASYLRRHPKLRVFADTPAAAALPATAG